MNFAKIRRETIDFFNIKEEVAMCVFFAEEPHHDEFGFISAPSRFQVWCNRNVPTFLVLWGRARYLRDATICRYRGHDFVDNGSYANAESGAEHMCCKRCGFCFDHIYY